MLEKEHEIEDTRALPSEVSQSREEGRHSTNLLTSHVNTNHVKHYERNQAGTQRRWGSVGVVFEQDPEGPTGARKARENRLQCEEEGAREGPAGLVQGQGGGREQSGNRGDRDKRADEVYLTENDRRL